MRFFWIQRWTPLPRYHQVALLTSTYDFFPQRNQTLRWYDLNYSLSLRRATLGGLALHLPHPKGDFVLQGHVHSLQGWARARMSTIQRIGYSLLNRLSNRQHITSIYISLGTCAKIMCIDPSRGFPPLSMCVPYFPPSSPSFSLFLLYYYNNKKIIIIFRSPPSLISFHFISFHSIEYSIQGYSIISNTS